ncbi:hypothetical protein C8J57DRAFT_323629 [Mycena rebaudengoi]|nr:hypothetical protein C8J57DRAFT_323629 [Mycena rebaudengoi]
MNKPPLHPHFLSLLQNHLGSWRSSPRPIATFGPTGFVELIRAAYSPLPTIFATQLSCLVVLLIHDPPLKTCAMEAAVGLVGAAATVGAAKLTSGSGFTGRHESSHLKELMEMTRNMSEFMENLKSSEVTQEEEVHFLKTMDEATQRQNEYHESIDDYKESSWLKFLTKFKKRMNVRKAKRSTRKSNHSLRSLNGSMHSGSDTSSICASAGSPPGSNLAVDEIRDWTYDTANARDFDSRVGRERIRARPKRLIRPTSLPVRLNTLVEFVEAVRVRRRPSLVRDSDSHRNASPTWSSTSDFDDFGEEPVHAERQPDPVSRSQTPQVQRHSMNYIWTDPHEPARRLRKGLWNRRGDHLILGGYIVFAPPSLAYPAELNDYPPETVGYRDHLGRMVPYRASRPELPESLPRFGQPPRRPYETFLKYVDEATVLPFDLSTF